jgi:hypothetical protein
MNMPGTATSPSPGLGVYTVSVLVFPTLISKPHRWKARSKADIISRSLSGLSDIRARSSACSRIHSKSSSPNILQSFSCKVPLMVYRKVIPMDLMMGITSLITQSMYKLNSIGEMNIPLVEPRLDRKRFPEAKPRCSNNIKCVCVHVPR